MRVAILLVCLLTGAAGVVTPAHAQQFPPFGSRLGPGLRGDDLKIVTDVTAKLNAAGTKGSEGWSNAQTGTSGTVTLVRGFHRSGMECHEMKYRFDFVRPVRHQNYTLDWCRTPTGEWRISS